MDPGHLRLGQAGGAAVNVEDWRVLDEPCAGAWWLLGSSLDTAERSRMGNVYVRVRASERAFMRA